METPLKIDLAFRIQSQDPISFDHGYGLFGAISRIIPAAHESNTLGILPLRGVAIGNRMMRLTDQSRLRLRVETSDIANYLALAGKSMEIDGAKVRIGVPEVLSLVPATAVRSSLVTTKNCLDIERFQAELRRQLMSLSISEEATFAVGKRRTIRIRDKNVVGYEIIVEGLTAPESINLQSQGLGGRRHMGCGLFVPMRIPR